MTNFTKKIYLLPLMLGLSFSGFSQFTASNSPSIGDQTSLYIVDSSATNYVSVTGTNVEWDYSSLSNYGETRLISVSDPSTITHNSTFPTAESAISVEGLLDVFYTEDNAKRTAEGIVYHDIDGDIIFNLAQKKAIFYDYPMAYGDIISDTAIGVSILPDFGGLLVPTVALYYATVDGEGTLKLPGGNEYHNVLRYRLTDTIVMLPPAPYNEHAVVVDQFEYYDFSVSNLPIFVHSSLRMFSMSNPAQPKRDYSFVLSRDVDGFNVNNAPQIGDFVNLFVADSSATDYASITGSGATWNYTDLADYDAAKKMISVEPVSNSAYAADFASADKMIVTEDLLDVFVEETANGRVGHGLVYHDGTDDLVLSLNAAPATYYSYPFNLGDEISDDVAGTASVTFNGNTFSNVPTEGKFYTTIDGEGTLELGNSNSPNSYDVYRYYLADTLTLTFPGSIGEYTVINHQYEYYLKNGGNNLPVFTHTYMKFGPTGGTPKVEYTLVLSKEVGNDDLAPAIGDFMELNIVDSTTANLESVTGAGVTWDYTELEDYDETRTIQVVNLSASPEGSTFSEADRAILTEGIVDAYISETPSQRIGHGLVYHDDADGDLLLDLNIDKAKLMNYPFSLGDAITDHVEGSAQFTIGGSLLTVPAEGEFTTTYDGNGTLMLGNAAQPFVYSNVTRIKTTSTITMQVTSSIEYTVETKQFEYYDYTVSNLPIFIHSYLWMGPTGGTAKKEFTYVLSKDIVDPTLAVNEMELNADVVVYPNPAINAINVVLNDNFIGAEVSLLDATGKIISTTVNNNGLVEMNVYHLASGLYFVNIESNDSVITRKVVVK